MASAKKKERTTMHFERDCNRPCKSKQHGDEIIAVLTKRALTSEEICAYLNWLCSNCGSAIDSWGRNALHMAASRGLLNVVEWLLKCRHALPNVRDKESGYTALHRSIFYGQIHVAVYLIKFGVDMNVFDNEALTACDLAAMNRQSYLHISPQLDSEVYVWGTNNNYTLGLQEKKLHPVLLSKQSMSFPVKQVCLQKFHCLMLTKNGHVYSCGHGEGGRLGLGKQKAAVELTKVDLSNAVCQQVAIGVDHSLFLLESGTVMSCGSNTFHVLGLLPPPEMVTSPRQIQALKEDIIGIAAGRYHSVAWSKTKIYTWGLHAGQLGHNFYLETKTIVKPKEVPFYSDIDCVAVSTGATVVAVPGSIYVLHKYKSQKIASRLMKVKKIAVIGGFLNDNLDESIKSELSVLKIAVLSVDGAIYTWQEKTMLLTRCLFSINRPLTIEDIALNKRKMLLVTNNGEAFQGEHEGKKLSETKRKCPLGKLLQNQSAELITVTRLANVYRAVAIYSDLTGLNYAVLQNDPTAYFKKSDHIVLEDSTIQMNLLNLLKNSDELDTIHDVLFQCGTRKFAAHKFIIASASEKLYEIIKNAPNTVIEINYIDEAIFEEILQYIYGGVVNICHLLNDEIDRPRAGKSRSAPLYNAAKQLGVLRLCKCLEHGVKSLDNEIVTFDRKSLPQLYDVQIKCLNGHEIPAHKCILAARLDYFNNLFALRWNKTNSKTSVSLSTTATIAEVILEFLYTDIIGDQNTFDIDNWVNILKVADELFINRLKNICEIQIFKQITLRNAAQFYEFALMYNCKTLEILTKEMICINLAPILENRTLETLDDEHLEKLTNFYVSWNTKLHSRIITPYSSAPEDGIVQSINESFPIDMNRVEPLFVDKSSSKKKSRLRKNSTNEQIPSKTPTKTEHGKFYKVNSDCFADTWKMVPCRSKSCKLPKKNSTSIITINLGSSSVDKVLLGQEIRHTYLMECRPGLASSPSPPPPPSYCCHSESEFPDVLSSNSPKQKSHLQASSTPKNVTNGKMSRLSQKQRKKLSLEESEKPTTNEASTSKKAWNIPEMPSSPINPISPNNSQEKVTLSDIITEEHRRKENVHRLQTKSLNLTIIEDEAIEDLKRFYNTEQMFDEYLIVKRASDIELPTPIWVCNSQRKF